MKLFVAVLFCLIAGTHCQLLPTAGEVECATDFVANNPADEDVLQVAASCLVLDLPSNTSCSGLCFIAVPLAACANESCKTPLGHILSRCGFNIEQGEL